MPAIFISYSGADRELASEVKAALTELGYEHTFLDFDKTTGFSVGERWEKRLYDELSRCHAVVLILTRNWDASKWSFAELAQARALGKTILPVQFERLDGKFVLPDLQTIDWHAGGLERLKLRLRTITQELARGFKLDPVRPPYPGINAFQKEDAAIYFGRDEESHAVLEILNARRTQGGARFVIIIGASGSGKSSLLKASVLPLLERERAEWVLLPHIRPERAPMESLAKALTEHAGKPEAWRDLHDMLNGSSSVAEIKRLVQNARIGAAKHANVLLPIDQFEELFTVTPTQDRTAFLRLLSNVFTSVSDFMVIATGRSDVLEGLIESSELVGNYSAFPLTAMPLDRYHRLIEGPAEVAGIAVEDRLSERIIKDVESKEALPLLAHMLRKLYESGAHDRKLSLAEYEHLGDPENKLNPIQNSIRLSADNATADASESERDALRNAFLQLVRVRLEDGKRVRQAARRSELPPHSLRLLDKLTEARLLTTRSHEGDHEPLVEVTHEALFKAWPTLDRWFTEEQAFLTDLERMRGAHENWLKTPDDQKSGELLYGLLLSRARDWLLKYPQRFVSREMEPLRAFIAASAEVANAEIVRRQRIRRVAFAGMAGATAVFALIAGIAFWQYDTAEKARRTAVAADEATQRALTVATAANFEARVQREAAVEQRNRAEEQAKLAIEQRNRAQITQSRFLVGKARDVMEKDPATALALALEALPDQRRGIERPYVPDAEAVLYEAVTKLRQQRFFERPDVKEGSEVDVVSLTPDGRNFVTFSRNRTEPLFQDAATGRLLFALKGHSKGVPTVEFSPDQKLVVTASEDHTARTWRATDGRPLREFKGHTAGLVSAVFSPDGKRILTGSEDRTVRIWDANDETVAPVVISMPKTLQESDDPDQDEFVHQARFSPDGSRVITLSGPKDYQRINLARIWDAKTGDAIRLLGADESGGWTDGRYALTVKDTEGARTSVWDVASASQIAELKRLRTDAAMAFAPDGSVFVTTSGNEIQIWNPLDVPRFGAPYFGRPGEVAGNASHPVIAPDAQRLAVFVDMSAPPVFGSTMLTVWTIPNGREIVVLPLPGPPLGPPSFSPDGRRIATLLPDGLRIWDATASGVVPFLYHAPDTRTSSTMSNAAFSPDGRRVAVGSTDSTAKVWDTASGELIASRRHPREVLTVAFLPDGNRFVTLCGDGKIRIWATDADGEPTVLGEHQNAFARGEHNVTIAWLAVSPDGKRVASGASEGPISVWTVGANTSPSISGSFPKPVYNATFSPDGRHLLAVSEEKAWLWNGVAGASPVRLGEFEDIASAAFSADGQRIVLGEVLGRVQVVEAESLKPVSSWQAHDAGVERIEFSADGRAVLTSFSGAPPALWDVASGEKIAVLPGRNRVGATAVFSTYGWIATASAGNDLHLWPTFESTQALVDHARAVMPRPLSDQLRKQHFLEGAAKDTIVGSTK